MVSSYKPRFTETAKKKLRDKVYSGQDLNKLASHLGYHMDPINDDLSDVQEKAVYDDLYASIEKLSDAESQEILDDLKEGAPRRLKTGRDYAINNFSIRLKELVGKYGRRKAAEDISFEIEELLHTILGKENGIDDEFILNSLRKLNRKVQNGKREPEPEQPVED